MVIHFEDRGSYAQVDKIYSSSHNKSPDTKYSPGVCVGMKKKNRFGLPDMAMASTSHVERQNLTMRMSMRRFTRLTNAFSKKVDNHGYALALYFFHYNFCRQHKSLRVSPAMAAGVSKELLSMETLCGIMDQQNPPKKRGPYKKGARVSFAFCGVFSDRVVGVMEQFAAIWPDASVMPVTTPFEGIGVRISKKRYQWQLEDIPLYLTSTVQVVSKEYADCRFVLLRANCWGGQCFYWGQIFRNGNFTECGSGEQSLRKLIGVFGADIGKQQIFAPLTRNYPWPIPEISN